MKKYKKQKFLAVSLSLLACFTMTLPQIERKVSASSSEEIINPIAKYEFKDEVNPGKDTMGNYDLALVSKVNTTGGTISVSEGVATFNGTAGLIAPSEEKDISEKLGSFTLAFDVSTSVTNSGWASPIGFGWNNWDPSKWATFQFANESDLLRFSTASSLSEGKGNVDGNGNAFWGHEIGNTGTNTFHKVILTVNLSGNIDVYFDGVNKYSYKTPENYSLKDGSMRFAMGGEGVWGNLYNTFIGQLRNVEIYDFALSEVEAKQYNATGKVYRALDVFVKEANVDLSESVVVPSNASDAEIMLYAPETSIADVTMSNGSTSQATIKWTNVTTIEDVKYLEGTISGLANKNNVKAYGKITLVDNVKELLPIAKYEFNDASNPGKDSMGNFDLTVSAASEDTPANIVVNNGVATFDGSASLISMGDNDITKSLKSFTLAFKIKANEVGSSWSEPIGFGWDDWNPSKWALFELSQSKDLRFTTASGIDENTGYGNVDGNTDQWWGKVIGDVSDYANIVLTVDEKTITVYYNGLVKYQYNLPENYSVSGNNMHFAIGGNGTWGSTRNMFNGSIANVAIYDFAINETQAKVIGLTNSVNTINATSYIESVETTPTFLNDKVSNETLYSNMSEEEMLALINDATITAKLTDASTKTLNVKWNEIVNENGTYTLKGYANATMQGVLTTIKGQEISLTLNVETKQEPDVPSVEPSVEPSSEPSVDPSSEPSSEVSSEATSSSETTSSTEEEKPNKKGCKGSATASLVGLIACALVLKKKRK